MNIRACCLLLVNISAVTWMSNYFVDLVMRVTVEADSQEAAEALAPRLAEAKLCREGMNCLVVQPVEETDDE